MSQEGEEKILDELVFVGTGVSTGIPILGHLDGSCDVCSLACSSPSNPNRRNNVSLLVNIKPRKHHHQHQHQNQNQNQHHHHHQQQPTPELNILIDCGKTFREAFLTTLSPRHLTSLTSLLLTHDHADATAGLDELYHLQTFTTNNTTTTTTTTTTTNTTTTTTTTNNNNTAPSFVCTNPLPTFLSQHTLNTLSIQFPDIIQASKIIPSSPSSPSPSPSSSPSSPLLLSSPTTSLDFHILNDEKPTTFFPHPLSPPFVAIPVMHGEPYICLGFSFGITTTVLYLSDVSSIPSPILSHLSSLPPFDIMVIDCLLPSGKEHFSHFCLDQMWETTKLLKPKKTYGVGMYCSLEHEKTNKWLEERFNELKGEQRGQMESVEVAYDGLVLKVPLF